jgi:hypothetical protein
MEGLKEAILKGFEPELVVTLEAMPGKQVRMNLLKTIISTAKSSSSSSSGIRSADVDRAFCAQFCCAWHGTWCGTELAPEYRRDICLWTEAEMSASKPTRRKKSDKEPNERDTGR